MGSVPDYRHLSHDDQRECAHWNAARAVNPHSPLLPALSNPPADHQLFTTGYETFDDLKKALDDYTLNAGFKAVVRRTGPTYKRLFCSRGEKRESVATQRKTNTIKCDCEWSALATNTRKEEAGAITWSWVLKIDKPTH